MEFDNKKLIFLTVVFFVFLFLGTEISAAACSDSPTESPSGCTVSIRYQDTGGSELVECKYQVVSQGGCLANNSWTPADPIPDSCNGSGPVYLRGTISIVAGTYDVCWYSKDNAGNVNQNKKMTVKIGSAADFSISASPTSLRGPLVSGASDPSTIVTVNSLNSFNSAVALSVIWCSGPSDTTCSQSRPGGLSESFSSNPVTPSANGSINSTLSIDANNPTVGVYYFRARGISSIPSLTHDTLVITLTIVNLSVTLSANPFSGPPPLDGVDLTAAVGGTAVGTINYKLDCNVSGSPGSLVPSGGTWDYVFNNISDNPKTVVDACNYSSAGTYTAGVRAERDAANPAEATAVITVTAVCTGVLTASISGTGTCTVTASLSASNCNGQTWSIQDGGTIKCSGTVSGTPYSNTCSSWTVSTNSYTYTLYIGGAPQDGKSATCSATPVAFDFSISISPTSGPVNQGSSISATVNTSLTPGAATQLVYFSVSGLPSGASAPSPVSCSPSCSSVITINTLAATAVGTYPISVCGTGGGQTHCVIYGLTVTAAGAGISPPSVTTNSATNITKISATLNGTLNNMGNAASVLVWFEWGLTASYGNSTPIQTMTATGAFSANISGLTSNTTYYFKARAKNGGSW